MYVNYIHVVNYPIQYLWNIGFVGAWAAFKRVVSKICDADQPADITHVNPNKQIIN